MEPLKKLLIKSQHLLDCLYKVICGHSKPFRVDRGVVSKPLLENIPSATRLETVGVCIVGTTPTLKEVRLNGTRYLKSAKLELPRVELFDYSEAAFHNLALHEQRAFRRHPFPTLLVISHQEHHYLKMCSTLSRCI